MAGKRVKCPACANVWRVPASIIAAEVVPQSSMMDPEWFDDAMSEEYKIATREPEPSTPPVPLFQQTAATSETRSSGNDFFAPEKKGLSNGVVGGFAMMLIAVVWFVAGYSAGYIFFYPPILFVIGLVGLLKGLFTGNFAGGD